MPLIYHSMAANSLQRHSQSAFETAYFAKALTCELQATQESSQLPLNFNIVNHALLLYSRDNQAAIHIQDWRVCSVEMERKP